jgi:F-type H+-transporting ATPase subunit a
MDLKPWWWYTINGVIAGAVVLGVLALAASKREKIPGRLQNFFEYALDGLKSLFLGALGEGGERHLPLILALFFYILVSNFLGFVPGLTSPTAATSTTIALGLIVFVYVHYYGIKTSGWGYFKHYMGPILILTPLFIVIEVVGELSKPFSLAMRLFGNIFGEDQLVDQVNMAQGKNFLLHLIPFQIPINLLQAFTDLVQAFIFALLSCAYISIMTLQHHDNGDSHNGSPHAMDADEKMKESLAGMGGNL